MIIDIVIIAIIALSAFMGYKKGLAGILVSIISLFLAIILGVLLQGSVADYLYNKTEVGKTIESSISTMINENIENIGNVKEQVEDSNDEKNVEENEVKENDKKDYKENFLNNFFDEDELKNQVVQDSAKKLTFVILKGLAFIGIFILVFLICYIIRMILNIVFSLPILGTINKAGGIVLNVAKSVFMIWLVLALVSFVTFIPLFANVANMIDSSIITKFLFENNLIVNILKSKLKG